MWVQLKSEVPEDSGAIRLERHDLLTLPYGYDPNASGFTVDTDPAMYSQPQRACGFLVDCGYNGIMLSTARNALEMSTIIVWRLDGGLNAPHGFDLNAFLELLANPAPAAPDGPWVLVRADGPEDYPVAKDGDIAMVMGRSPNNTDIRGNVSSADVRNGGAMGFIVKGYAGETIADIRKATRILSLYLWRCKAAPLVWTKMPRETVLRRFDVLSRREFEISAQSVLSKQTDKLKLMQCHGAVCDGCEDETLESLEDALGVKPLVIWRQVTEPAVDPIPARVGGPRVPEFNRRRIKLTGNIHYATPLSLP